MFLAASNYLIIGFVIQLTNDIFHKWIFGAIAFCIELLAQFVLALGVANWKKNQKNYIYVLYFFIFTCYMLVLAIPSAIGFFGSDIDVQEQVASKAEFIESINKTTINQNQVTIDKLNQQLETESKSGYGIRSEKIMAEIKRLTQEQKELQSNYTQSAASQTVIAKDIFTNLEKILFGIPANILKTILFGYLVIMIYVGLILFHWNIDLDRMNKRRYTKKLNYNNGLKVGA
jgi:predicted PurR-regulated permease PerM